MEKFNYRFQKILDFKTREKEKAQANMSKAMNHLNVSVKEDVKRVEDRIKSIQREMNQKQVEGVSIHTLIANQNYLSKLNTELVFAQRKLNSAKLQVTQKQFALNNKLKEEKTFSTLKEHEQEEHSKEMQKVENAQLEEVAIQKYYQNKIANNY